MRLPSCHYSKPQFFLRWLNKTRTCITAFVAQHSYPLNYKPVVVRLSDLNWKHSSYVYLSERKEDDYVAVTPSRIGWLSRYIGKPCSPHSQCGTLPDKLKPTFNHVQYEWIEHSPPVWKTGTPPPTHILHFIFVIEDRLELSSSASKTDMLSHCTTQ